MTSSIAMDDLVQALWRADDAMRSARNISQLRDYDALPISDELVARIARVMDDVSGLYDMAYDAREAASQPLTADVADFA